MDKKTGKSKRITLRKSVKEARDRSAGRLERENASISARLRNCQGTINIKKLRDEYREHKRLAKLRSRAKYKHKLRQDLRGRDLLPSCFKSRKEFSKNKPIRTRSDKSSSSFRRAIWRFEHFVTITRSRACKNAMRRWKMFHRWKLAEKREKRRLRRRAAITVQRYYRSYHVRLSYRVMVQQHIAASRIQNLMRCRIAKKRFECARETRRVNTLLKFHYETVRMSCTQRRYLATMFANMALRETCYLDLVVRRALIRVSQHVIHLRRRNIETRKKEVTCATCLQSVMRGHIARREVLEIREERRKENAAIRIAICLQSVMRGHIARREVLEIREDRRKENAAIRIQTWQRSLWAKREMKARRDMLHDEEMLAVQRRSQHARCPKQHMFVKPKLRLKKIYGDESERSVVLIQHFVRDILKRRTSSCSSIQLKSHNAAVSVQSQIRRFLASKRLCLMRRCLVRDDSCEELDVNTTSREEMLSILDHMENEEEEVRTSDKHDTKQEKKNSTSKEKKTGTTYTRGTFFGTYRRSAGGNLYLKKVNLDLIDE